MAENNWGLDEDQQEACDVNVNAVVGAGAGSGKTTVLKKRVAKLIEKDGLKIDRLLILTFTDKAAIEMKSRIYDELSKHDSEASRQAVADFSNAHIQTLDSYFAEIGKYGAKDFGFRPDFNVVDETYLNNIIEYKAKQFFELHADDPCLQTLCGTIKSEDIASSVFAAAVKDKKNNLVEPLDFEELFENQVPEVLGIWNETVDKVVQIIKTDRIAVAEEEIEKKKLERIQNGNFNFDVNEIKEKENFITILNNYDFYNLCQKIQLPLSSSFEDCRQDILQIMEKGGEERKSKIKEPAEVGLMLREEEKAKLKQLFDTFDLCIKYVKFYEDSKELSGLLQQFNFEIAEFKKEKSLLTFTDIAVLAKAVLDRNEKILRQEQKKFDRIMIDEFQDNNQLQCDVLLKLANGEQKLFFVGDEKQSIYAFRGADVSVFNNLKRSMESLDIKTNYRSTPELVAAYNSIFGGFEYPASDSTFFNEELPYIMKGAAEDYEAGYKTFVKTNSAKLESGEYDFRKKAITVALFNKGSSSEEDLSAREAEAIWTVNKIKELHDSDPDEYSYDKFFILMRTTTPLAEYEKALRDAGIDYISDAYKNIFEDGPVNDIYNLLNYCVTGEKNALAKVLASPFVNYSIKRLETELASKNQEEILKELPEIAQLKDDVQRLSVTELVQKIWYETGYKLEVEWNKTVRIYRYLFDLIFEQARKADSQGYSLIQFLEHIKSYDDSSSKMDDVSIPVEAQNAVRIMTIHKSKGLENDVVFVVGISDNAKSDSTAPEVFIDERLGATFAFGDEKGDKSSIFATKSDRVKEENSKAEAELKRVAYVALTRAKKRLYLVGDYNGSFDSRDNKDGCRNIYQLMKPLLDYYNDESRDEIRPYSFEEIKAERMEAETDNTLEAKIAYSENISIPEKSELQIKPEIHYTTPSREEDNKARPNPGYRKMEKLPEISALKNLLGNDDEHLAHNDFGTLAHAYMEYEMKGEKLPESMWCQVPEREKVEGICKVMSDRFLFWYREQMENCRLENPLVKTELPFRVYDESENKIVYGSMDLLFQTAENDFVLVDYKTDSEINTEKYRPQLDLYKKAVEGLHPGCKVQRYLYFLQYGAAINL